MVKLRLRRGGKKKQPHYRIVAADSRFPRDGRFLEIVGYYSPITKPKKLEIDARKALVWLKNGAQPTDTVRSLLSKKGIMTMWHEVRNGKTIEEVLPAEPVVEEMPVVEAPKVEEAPAEVEALAEETATEQPEAEETPEAPEESTEAPTDASAESGDAEEETKTEE